MICVRRVDLRFFVFSLCFRASVVDFFKLHHYRKAATPGGDSTAAL
jgi:hypothetical protein